MSKTLKYIVILVFITNHTTFTSSLELRPKILILSQKSELIKVLKEVLIHKGLIHRHIYPGKEFRKNTESLQEDKEDSLQFLDDLRRYNVLRDHKTKEKVILINENGTEWLMQHESKDKKLKTKIPVEDQGLKKHELVKPDGKSILQWNYNNAKRQVRLVHDSDQMNLQNAQQKEADEKVHRKKFTTKKHAKDNHTKELSSTVTKATIRKGHSTINPVKTCIEKCFTPKCEVECSGTKGSAACSASSCSAVTHGIDSASLCTGELCHALCYKDECIAACEGPVCFGKCHGKSCHAIGHGRSSQTICLNDECISYANGPDVNAKCIGKLCEAQCIGTRCVAKCEGVKCVAGCNGEKCEAHCSGKGCHQTVHSNFMQDATGLPNINPDYGKDPLSDKSEEVIHTDTDISSDGQESDGYYGNEKHVTTGSDSDKTDDDDDDVIRHEDDGYYGNKNHVAIPEKNDDEKHKSNGYYGNKDHTNIPFSNNNKNDKKIPNDNSVNIGTYDFVIPSLHGDPNHPGNQANPGNQNYPSNKGYPNVPGYNVNQAYSGDPAYPSNSAHPSNPAKPSNPLNPNNNAYPSNTAYPNKPGFLNNQVYPGSEAYSGNTGFYHYDYSENQGSNGNYDYNNMNQAIGNNNFKLPVSVPGKDTKVGSNKVVLDYAVAIQLSKDMAEFLENKVKQIKDNSLLTHMPNLNILL